MTMHEPASASASRRSLSAMRTRQTWFEQLVHTHSADLYRHAWWLCGQESLAQDLVQETFLRAWRALDTLRDEAAAKGWLLTILRREHARLYERKALPSVDIDALELLDDAPDPEARRELAALRAAIARLPPRYREPLVLQVLGGYSLAEIARELGSSETAVMSQVFRARQQLKAMLDDASQEAEDGLR